MAHDVVLKEKITGTAAVQLSNALTLPNLFQKEGFDNYKGAKNGTVDVIVEGVLPWHTYPWKQDVADRNRIVWDEYKERTVGVTLGGHMYSGVRVTDEQKDLDLVTFAKLTGKQTQAIADGVNFAAADFASLSTNYDVTVNVESGANAADALRRLRRVSRGLHMPGAPTLAVGGDWEEFLLASKDLNLASNVGDALAQSAVQEASLGRRYGINIVVIDELDPSDAILFGSQAFVFANAAPSVPDSIPFGATGSADGISLRILRDYDPEIFVDRSVVDSWYGFRAIKDVLGARVNAADNSLTISESEYVIRAVKVTLDGTAGALTGGDTGELSKMTKVKTADLTVSAPAEDGGDDTP